MYNDRLSSEEAREHIQERMKEVETYSLQKQLGYDSSKSVRWIILFTLLLIAAALWLLF